MNKFKIGDKAILRLNSLEEIVTVINIFHKHLHYLVSLNSPIYTDNFYVYESELRELTKLEKILYDVEVN